MPRTKDYRKVPSKHSAMVIASKARALDLAAALDAQGDTAATALAEELRKDLRPGETLPDVRLFFELLARQVRRSREELDHADEQRFLEEMRVSVARHEAGEVQDELYAGTVQVRKQLVDLWGSRLARLHFGLSERTPRGATDLAIEARRIADRLSRPGLELPETRLPGITFDPAVWVESLRPSLERLERLLEEIAVRRMAVIDGIAECREALEACDATYLHVARTVEAVLVLAGRPELARRLRPKERRERPPRESVPSMVPQSVALVTALAVHAAVRFHAGWRALVHRACQGGFAMALLRSTGTFSRRIRGRTGVPELANKPPEAEIA